MPLPAAHRGEDRLDVAVVTVEEGLEKAIDAVYPIREKLGCSPSIVNLESRDVERFPRENDPW